MVINERALDLLQNNDGKIDSESYVLQKVKRTQSGRQQSPAKVIINENVIKTLPTVTGVFRKPGV